MELAARGETKLLLVTMALVNGVMVLGGKRLLDGGPRQCRGVIVVDFELWACCVSSVIDFVAFH